MDSDDEIRIPDEVITDQLVEDNRSDFEKEIDEAIYLSFQDIMNEEAKQQKYEKELIQIYENEKEKRTQYFSKLLFDLQKVGKLDKEVNEIYLIIEPIIESYCNQCFETFELDKIIYDKIFKVIRGVRTDKNAIELLKTIILS